MSKLGDLDKQQEIQRIKAKLKKKSGLINILVGIGVIIFDIILFHHLFIWILGGFLIIRGLVGLLSGIKNCN
jgi:hypothetical protein